MKIGVGLIMQETDSFSPVTTTLQNFKDYYFIKGEEIPEKFTGISHEIAGFIDVSTKENFTPLYTIAANAISSGAVESKTLNYLIQEMLNYLDNERDIDGFYMVLHGGMLVDEIGDGSGMILQHLRRKLGKDIPIVASVDLHANITSLMVQNCNAIRVYHTFPHVDQRETGTIATEILLKTIKKEIHPTMSVFKIPMTLPVENALTDIEPSKKIIKAMEDMEKKAGIVSASFCTMQPWFDSPEAGCSTVVVSDGNMELAKKEARNLADLFWSLRDDYLPILIKPEDAIKKALSTQSGPIFLLEGGDAPAAGAPGDGTLLLKLIIDMKVDKLTYFCIADPEAVDCAIKAGLGATVTVSLGGKIDTFSKPIKVTGRVKTITDGVFKNQGPFFKGVENHMGRTVVLVADKIYIVVTELAAIAIDSATYRSVGLRPEDAHIVCVKTPVIAYGNTPKEVLFLDILGASCSNLKNLPFKKIKRPFYPFDIMKDYEHIEFSNG